MRDLWTTNGIAEAAGVPATINDPELSRRVGAALKKALGKENVVQGKFLMASEDFSLFALADSKPPIMMFWLGAVDPAKIKDAQEKGTRLPSLHSSEYQPLPEPAIRTGVKAMASAVEELLKK